MARILVVDDDPGVRSVVEITLDEHELSFAEDGLEALEMLDGAQFDCIVMDVMMPRLDGVEAIRRIRATAGGHEDVPIVMLTAKVGEDDHLRGFAAGADAYLTKPFDPEALVAVIDEVCALTPEARQAKRDEERARAALLRQLERRFD